MSTADRLPRAILAVEYAEYAHEYLRSLPLEHFMEATAQGTQRETTLESLAILKVRRPDVQVFNELLVQYPRPRQRRPGQVVPDNMVVIWPEPLDPDGSYDVPLQPVGPFWVLEYVSKHNKRKDYEDNLCKYERELKVPYYLVFYPDTQDLSLFHLEGRRYRAVPPNEHGRHPIPELELEVALRDGWVRFWHRGELLQLPADRERELDQIRRRLQQAEQVAEQEKQRTQQAEQVAEQEKQRAQQAEQVAEQEKQRAQQAEQVAEQEKQRAQQAEQVAEQEKQRADQEKQARQALEREVERLRARLEGPPPRRPKRS
jgi:Uma2 family endonuclease